MLAGLVAALGPAMMAQIPPGLSGTWEGTSKLFTGERNHSLALVMLLRQEGDTITGSIGPSADHQLLVISNGKIAGKTFSFDLGNEEAKMSITGQLNAEQAQGNFRTNNKQGVTMTGTGAGNLEKKQMTFQWSATRNDGVAFHGELQFTKSDH
jgi:hypothetical protein